MATVVQEEAVVEAATRGASWAEVSVVVTEVGVAVVVAMVEHEAAVVWEATTVAGMKEAGMAVDCLAREVMGRDLMVVHTGVD